MKAPLAAIKNTVNRLLMKKMVTDPVAISLLKPVVTSSRMLFFQVNELLDQSLIRANRLEQKISLVTLKDTI